jgi:hypothetical protein
MAIDAAIAKDAASLIRQRLKLFGLLRVLSSERSEVQRGTTKSQYPTVQSNPSCALLDCARAFDGTEMGTIAVHGWDSPQ